MSFKPRVKAYRVFKGYIGQNDDDDISDLLAIERAKAKPEPKPAISPAKSPHIDERKPVLGASATIRGHLIDCSNMMLARTGEAYVLFKIRVSNGTSLGERRCISFGVVAKRIRRLEPGAMIRAYGVWKVADFRKDGRRWMLTVSDIDEQQRETP